MSGETDLPALEVDLPRLGGLRPLAEAMLAPFHSEFQGETVVLNARRMTVWTPSYAAGLVSGLKEYGATDILVVNATEDFGRLVTDAGAQYGIETKVVGSDDPLPRTRLVTGLQTA